MSRRAFIRKSAAIGATSLVGKGLISTSSYGAPESFPNAAANDVSVVKGPSYFDNTVKAVEQLGGMSQFVPRGSRVAILANPQRNNPGAFTKPDVLRAAIKMCQSAGASEVSCISCLPAENWQRTGLRSVVDAEEAKLIITDHNDESQFKPVPVPQGKALKEASIMKAFFDHEVFIDMPITKDHVGNKFTGTMKNLMGINYRESNRTFHRENWRSDPDSIAWLDQCIADLNTIITPDLCIVDATEFVTTNGPFGPGELLKPQKVVAGTDRVAVDAYCCSLWGLEGKDIIMINRAFEHGLGEIDLSKVKITESEA